MIKGSHLSWTGLRPRPRTAPRNSRAEFSSRYTAINDFAYRYPKMHADDDLSSFEFSVFSQNGEDGVIAEILNRIRTENCFFIEFGIDGGIEGNCVTLADLFGWAGVFVEPDPESFANLQLKYAGSKRVQTINAFVRPDNVNQLFDSPTIPHEPDVFSIDIDGNDIWVWDALEIVRPRLLVIEYNGGLPVDSTIAQSPDTGHHFDGRKFGGAALGALEVIAERKGYKLVHTDLCGVNAFFVRNDLFDLIGIENPPRRTANYYFSGIRWENADIEWVELSK